MLLLKKCCAFVYCQLRFPFSKINLLLSRKPFTTNMMQAGSPLLEHGGLFGAVTSPKEPKQVLRPAPVNQPGAVEAAPKVAQPVDKTNYYSMDTFAPLVFFPILIFMILGFAFHTIEPARDAVDEMATARATVDDATPADIPRARLRTPGAAKASVLPRASIHDTPALLKQKLGARIHPKVKTAMAKEAAIDNAAAAMKEELLVQPETAVRTTPQEAAALDEAAASLEDELKLPIGDF